jgi:hypothetical protein
MAERLQRLAKKEAHVTKMKDKYEGWHARADCTGVVPKKTDDAKKSEEEKKKDEIAKKFAANHPPLETGVMRLLVVR